MSGTTSIPSGRFGACLFRSEGACRAREQLGPDETRAEGLKSSFASTGQKSRCSTKRGCSRTSKRPVLSEQRNDAMKNSSAHILAVLLLAVGSASFVHAQP